MDTIDATSRQPAPWAHLHIHSEYSLLDGAIRINDLLKYVKDLGHTAVALTDHGNLFGAIEFYTKAKSMGIKPIIGSEIFHQCLHTPSQHAELQGSTTGVSHLVLLAKNLDGYKKLIKIVSSPYLGEGVQSGEEVPVVTKETLQSFANSSELFALSSCLKGEFARLVKQLKVVHSRELKHLEHLEGTAREALALIASHIEQMHALFGKGNYFIELIDNNLPEQKILLPDLVAVAKHFDLPLVASADAHYLKREQSEAHSVLLGIKHGLTMRKLRGRRKNTFFHVFNNEEMQAAYQQWPEALANTTLIADACNIELNFGQYYLPRFESGTDETAEQALRRIAAEMLEERFISLRELYGASFTPKTEQTYRERLEYELNVISSMGFPGYFLIVQDFINWAKSKNIPVGPGRGSGAGSIVAYALRITDLDPIPYNLLFERFLNPERVSMPDFDVDFCQDRRDEVIQYVTQRYGSDRVAQITTFGKMNAKAVVRDVGRVLELGYGRVDRIAKLIPDELGITLSDAMAKEPRLGEEAANDETVADLLRLSLELEGLSRHTSVHAAGVVISEGPMTDYVPIYKADNSGIITQYEMKMAEKVGLVKFDFLGLKTLTVILKAVELVRRRHKPDFDISKIPFTDSKVYKLISEGHSVGVFQLESSGMKALITKLKPSCFEDIIAVVALFRPGPLGSGMVDDFIERKHGRQALEYPLPQLEPILKDTYGIILYQEQVMKIAGELASYSLGEADLLRRAMGKKIAAEMEKQKSRFISGAVANQIDENKAAAVFDLMAEFANYGFNKSHSAAYGLISYQTAFLKAHYPEEFMAAIMTCDLDNTKKIVRYIDECRRMGINLQPPDINSSIDVFDVPGPNTISFGLAAIKGIGAHALQPLIQERLENGPYQSLDDLARRVNLQRVGKKTLELLTAVGALDCFNICRPKLHEHCGAIVKLSDDLHHAKSQGQRGLFDFDDTDESNQVELPSIESTWQLTERELIAGAPDVEWLKKEKSLLGVYLTGHPLDFYQEDVRSFATARIKDFPKYIGKKVRILAVLAMANERFTKNGSRMLSLRLEDPDLAIEAVMFDKDIPTDLPPANSVVVVSGGVDQSYDKTTIRFRVDRIQELEAFREEYVLGIDINLHAPINLAAKPVVSELHSLIQQHQGDTPLRFTIIYPQTQVKLQAPSVQVTVSDAFLRALKALPILETEISFQTGSSQ